MAKYKLRQFAELEQFSNVIHQVQTGEQVENHPVRGHWRPDFFRRDGNIILELGCGKGEYTLALASAFPDNLFVGVDLKGNRLWRGAKTALEQPLTNVGFLRTKIENLKTVFDSGEVNGIWITFPDPQPGLKREKKRLTGPAFLNMYREILAPGSEIHLKTDSQEFYSYSLEVASDCGKLLLQTNNLYAEPAGFLGEHHQILTGVQTYYEKKFLAQGKPICYLKFTL
jgi:tRNA (guanine-N7-)-methyltransferase